MPVLFVFMGNNNKAFWLLYFSRSMVPRSSDISKLLFFIQYEMILSTCYVVHLNSLILKSNKNRTKLYKFSNNHL